MFLFEGIHAQRFGVLSGRRRGEGMMSQHEGWPEATRYAARQSLACRRKSFVAICQGTVWKWKWLSDMPKVTLFSGKKHIC